MTTSAEFALGATGVAPRSNVALDVSGQVVSVGNDYATQTSATVTLDASKGNVLSLQGTTNALTGLTISNTVAGGSYSVIYYNNSGSASSIASGSLTVGSCSSANTRVQPAFPITTANGATTVITIIEQNVNGTLMCYASWITGF
jgi:hypothetical protein